MIRYKNVYPTFRMIVLKFQYVSKLTVQSNRRLWRPRHSLRSQLIIYYYQLFGVYLAIAQSSTYGSTEFRISHHKVVRWQGTHADTAEGE